MKLFYIETMEKKIFGFTTSSWLHLRIPFSLFLMPVYLFAFGVSKQVDWHHTIISFIAIHLFLYPASNGYNSYFDKDEKSIGGLKKPPKVDKGLFYLSLLFDLVAFGLALIIHPVFMIMMITYSLVSRAYSFQGIRLKKYPLTSWVSAGFFQVSFTFWMAHMAITARTFPAWSNPEILYAGLLTTAMLMGSYPMTQIYQHEEDGKRGDKTLSMILGIKGTFFFTAIFFALTSLGFFLYFMKYYHTTYGFYFLGFMAPVAIYFGYWFLKVQEDISFADHNHTMKLNAISALCLGSFFLIMNFI